MRTYSRPIHSDARASLFKGAFAHAGQGIDFPECRTAVANALGYDRKPAGLLRELEEGRDAWTMRAGVFTKRSDEAEAIERPEFQRGGVPV